MVSRQFTKTTIPAVPVAIGVTCAMKENSSMESPVLSIVNVTQELDPSVTVYSLAENWTLTSVKMYIRKFNYIVCLMQAEQLQVQVINTILYGYTQFTGTEASNVY